MKEFWDSVSRLYNIEITYNGVTFTFWNMFMFFVLLSLAVWMISKFFD
jgi:hypothetical protein